MSQASDGTISLGAVTRSAAILTGSAVVAQVIAVGRELFLAANVGLSGELDALLIGLILPLTLASVLTSGTVIALVPAYLSARADGGLPAAQRVAGAVLFWVGAAALLLSLSLFLFAEQAVAIAGPGLGADQKQSAVEFLRLLSPLAFTSGISSVFFGILQAEQSFLPVAVSTIAGPSGTLLVMLGLWGDLGLTAFAVGSLVGPIVSLAVLAVAAIRRAIAPRPRLRGEVGQMRGLFRHAFPITMGSVALQLNIVTDWAVASLASAPGAISALRFGDILVRVPIGAISPAWGAAIYPALVRSTTGGDDSGLSRATDLSLRHVVALFVPIAMFSASLAPILVAVAYGRGAYSGSDLALTATVVVGFSPLIFILMASPVLTGALNAKRAGSLLLVGGLINAFLNVVLNIVLGLPLGVFGIALSTSISSGLVVVFFARRFARHEAGFSAAAIGRLVTKAIVAAAPASLLLAAIAWSGAFPTDAIGGLFVLAVAGLAGAAFYLGLSRRIGLAEPTTIVEVGLSAIRGRITRSPT